MLISTLLTLALGAPLAQASAPAPARAGPATASTTPQGGRAASRGWQAPALPQTNINGQPLTIRNPNAGTQIAALLGGSVTRVGGPVASVVGMPYHQVTQIAFGDPGTGWQESLLLGVPSIPLANPPLLVMFHGFGVSEMDCYINTPIFKQALDRGWYVVAPLGAHQLNFGIPYSQVNIEFVLDWVMTTFPVDPDRVYGVGFSMGGGGMASYMARHLDPDHARFAAVVNHTGGVSIANTYWNSVPNTFVFDDPQMFQGPPTQYPFAYSQVSLVDMDFTTGSIDPNTDMARNAAHIPMLNFTVSQEPLAYLRAQVLALHAWMQAFSTVEVQLEVFGTTHDWAHLDANVALDFLRQHTLQVPRSGTHRVLADREGQWHHFYVYQDAPGAFTPFRWTMLDALNRVIIDETQNLQRIVIDSAQLGLRTILPLEVMFGAQDGLPEEITLEGYVTAPLSVTRGGQVSSSWSWDPVTESVTLFDSNTANFPLWRITP